MVNTKKIIVPVGIFIVIVLLVAGGSFILNQEETQDFQNEASQNISADAITNTTEKEFSVKVSGTKLNLTSKPRFKVGERFKYRDVSSVQGVSTISESVVEVEKIEKLDGREHFVFSTVDDIIVKDPKTGEMVHDETAAKYPIFNYIDKENGRITKTVIKTAVGDVILDEEASSSYEGWVYSPWMLALKENLKWESYINMSVGGNKLSGPKSYRVVDIEKINGRECFKVELISKINNPNTNVQEINLRSIIWVDTKKRILVKKVKYVGNLKVSEKDLVDYIPPETHNIVK